MTPEQLTERFGIPAEWAGYASNGLDFGQSVLIALAIFTVGWFVSKWFYRMILSTVQSRGLDLALGRFAASLIQWTVLAAAGIAALEAVGLQTTSLVAVFASAGLAVGLALQGSLAHFASGVMLLVFRPFTIGDRIVANGLAGVVQEIGLFATVLITPSNEKVIIPNGAITANNIVNSTTLGTRRADVTVGVAYGVDLDRARSILEAATAQCSAVLADPAPAVVVSGLGASAVDITVMGWCTSSDYLTALAQLRQGCYDALNSAGIEIPFDQVVVHQASAAATAAA